MNIKLLFALAVMLAFIPSAVAQWKAPEHALPILLAGALIALLLTKARQLVQTACREELENDMVRRFTPPPS